MKLQRLKRTPFLIAAAVLALVCGLRALHSDFPERLERMTYDLRVRAAQHFPTATATNLAFVSIEESSIAAVKNSEELGFHFGLYWPRQIYGRVVEELSAQGAKTVAFDILFDSLRHDHPAVVMANGRDLMESDEFFAQQMRLASNVLIAVTQEISPPKLFATNALGHGDISASKDSDGILRRARAFCTVRHWHPLIENAAAKNQVKLDALLVEKTRIVLPLANGETLEIPLDEHGEMAVKSKKNSATPARAAPFTDERVWHMGIVLAAQALSLDLDHAEVDLPHRKITLRGAGGVQRVIPVDGDGVFYIDWRLTQNDPQLTCAPIEQLLFQDKHRLLGETNGLADTFKNKLVVVGSAAQGNDLTDRGATPLENDTLLVSKHWNVANSVITGQFIRRTTPGEDLAIIIFLGLFTALLTWQLRAFAASGGTLLLVAGYTALAFFSFIEFRLWLPLVFPVLGAILVEHVSLVTYRVVFEEREQRRVKSVFSKIVSPEIVHELLGAEKISLGGARREITVLFADVRGFTTFTDQLQEDIAEYVRTHDVDLLTAEKFYEESARETLATVNLYLAAVADAVKHHGGTLDKYIGDCVMAFWNAPVANEKHAPAAVAAAIEAQRAIHQLNVQRLAENTARELDNRARVAAGLPPKPLHIALQLGTGINTGTVIVGLMGSNQHILNYTVFGREVNLASRLEGVSGSGRIIISDTTYNHLLRHAPAVAAACTELFPVTVKGIKNAVRIYEVAWK